MRLSLIAMNYKDTWVFPAPSLKALSNGGFLGLAIREVKDELRSLPGSGTEFLECLAKLAAKLISVAEEPGQTVFGQSLPKATNLITVFVYQSRVPRGVLRQSK